LRSQRCFTDQSDADPDGSKDQRLLATDFVEEEHDKEEIEDGAYDVVDTSDEQISIAINSKVVVQYGGVIADHVDSAVRQQVVTGDATSAYPVICPNICMSVACISRVRQAGTVNMTSQPGAVIALSASMVSFISLNSF
jgi:hypothetical protein